MARFKTLKECKIHYPIDSIIEIRGRIIQITGYHFDGQYWWPVNVVEDFSNEIKEYVENELSKM